MSNNRFLDLEGLTKYTDLVKNYMDVKIDEVTDTINTSIENKVDKETFENRFEYVWKESLIPENRNPWTVYLVGNEIENSYLTIEALEDDLTVSFSLNTIQYSIDGCQTWIELPPYTATPAINAGDKISFKATGQPQSPDNPGGPEPAVYTRNTISSNTFGLTPSPGEGIGTFMVNKNFNLKGNVMSMLFGDEGDNSFDLTGYDYAFSGLFYDCTTLQSVSKDFLPATTLAGCCYSDMFNGCTSLVTAPELPATTIAEECYTYMFNGCTSLVTAPELPATTLAYGCYSSMFNGCTSLVTAPELSATTLARECYGYMFSDCTSLVTAPELPATTLAYGCYSSMFNGCTSLVTAPELPATTLAEYCYDSMFYGCSSLNYIKALFTTEPSSDYTYYWVDGVSPSGTFVKNADATWDVTGVDGIPEGWTVEIAKDYYLTIEALEDDLTVSFSTNTIQYSIDDCKTWNELSAGTAAPTINSRDKISFKATGLVPNANNGIGKFTVNKKFNLNGNVMSILFGDEGDNSYDLTGYDYAFAGLFSNCTTLQSVLKDFLPATTLADGCYQGMFSGCTSLVIAPELPATTLTNSCYTHMFEGCTSLNYIEALFTTTPSTSYTNGWVTGVSPTGTFVKNATATWNVTGDNGVPTGWIIKTEEDNYLTIEALEDDLTVSFSLNTIQYSIDGCQTWIELPADTETPAINAGDKISFKAVGQSQSPDSPEPTVYTRNTISSNTFGLTPSPGEGIGTFTVNKNFNLKGNVMSMLFGDEGDNSFDLTGYDYAFSYLFEECESLQSVSKDFLPATTLTYNCYESMFNGCTSLVTAPELPATTLANSCYLGMFSDCSSLVTAPSILPATTLASSCYLGMFYKCTSLTTAPELPATALAQGCYEVMFDGCSSLNYIKALFTTEPGEDYTYGWVDGVSSTGTFVKNASAAWDVTGVDGIPEGWTVQTANI